MGVNCCSNILVISAFVSLISGFGVVGRRNLLLVRDVLEVFGKIPLIIVVMLSSMDL